MKSKYENLKEKYNLPEYNDLDKEFSIEDIEGNNILGEIRKKMSEKVIIYIKFLEDILQPDTTLSSFYECTVLNSDLEKKKAFELYKKLMILDRSSLETCLLSSSESEAKFINQTFEEWFKIKQELIKLLNQVINIWKKEDAYTKFESEYMG